MIILLLQGHYDDIGYYQNGIRQGQWQAIYKNHVVFDGKYNINGFKEGVWIEPLDLFQLSPKVTQTGQYINGQQIGNWEIVYKGKIIGGCYYNMKGIVNGKFFLPGEKIENDWQGIIFFYNQNGFLVQMDLFFINHIITTGSFNDKNEKAGKWKEIQNPSINFQTEGECVIFSGGGTYDQQGRKQGADLIIFLPEMLLHQFYENQLTYLVHKLIN